MNPTLNDDKKIDKILNISNKSKIIYEISPNKKLISNISNEIKEIDYKNSPKNKNEIILEQNNEIKINDINF